MLQWLAIFSPTQARGGGGEVQWKWWHWNQMCANKYPCWYFKSILLRLYLVSIFCQLYSQSCILVNIGTLIATQSFSSGFRIYRVMKLSESWTVFLLYIVLYFDCVVLVCVLILLDRIHTEPSNGSWNSWSKISPFLWLLLLLLMTSLLLLLMNGMCRLPSCIKKKNLGRTKKA